VILFGSLLLMAIWPKEGQGELMDSDTQQKFLDAATSAVGTQHACP